VLFIVVSSQEPTPRHVAVKEVVLPFNKFPGADTLLGPEMRSTGEVMGIDYDFASSYAKAQIAAGEIGPSLCLLQHYNACAQQSPVQQWLSFLSNQYALFP
jgi:carbamoylphosphate synthase large subunit